MHDPSTAEYWEELLAAEGMPAELPSAKEEIRAKRKEAKANAARSPGKRARRRGVA